MIKYTTVLLLFVFIAVGGCSTTSRQKREIIDLLKSSDAARSDADVVKERISKRERVVAQLGWKTDEKNESSKDYGCKPAETSLFSALMNEDAFLGYLNSLREGFPYNRKMYSISTQDGKHVAINAIPAPILERVEMYAGKDRVLSFSINSKDVLFHHFGAVSGARPLGFSIQAKPVDGSTLFLLFAPIEDGSFEPKPSNFRIASADVSVPDDAVSLKVLVFSVCKKENLFILSRPQVVYLHLDIEIN